MLFTMLQKTSKLQKISMRLILGGSITYNFHFFFSSNCSVTLKVSVNLKLGLLSYRASKMSLKRYKNANIKVFVLAENKFYNL